MFRLKQKTISLPLLASISIGLQGIILVFDELTIKNFGRFELLIPGSRYGNIVVGSILLYIAFELRRAKRSAWWIATIFMLLAILFQLMLNKNASSIALSLTTLLILLFSYGHFRVVSEIKTITNSLKRAVILSSLFIFMCSIGFWILKARHFGTSFSLIESIKEATLQLYFGASNLRPLTRQAAVFMDLVDVVGYINYALILTSFFKPAADKFILAPHYQAQVLEILKFHSHSSEDYFKYWPHNKSYFFNATHTGFVSYKVVKGISVSPADPINSTKNRRKKLLQAYTRYAEEQSWTPVFAHVSELSKQMYEACGYKTIKIGASAVVQIDHFLAKTARTKNFRNVINRFQKAGYTYEVIKPHKASHDLMATLKRISDNWLELPGRSERGFFMGYFDESYIHESTLFVLRDATGRVVSFTNLQPNFGVKRASVDLMRHCEDALTNTMDYMFYVLAKYLKEQNWKELDLGLAPLAHLYDADKIEEKGLNLVYEYANRWFAFQGLARFKEKFEPNWEGSYLAYKGSRTELPLILYALDKVMEVDLKNN